MIRRDLFELVKKLTPTEKKWVRQHGIVYKKKGGNILLHLFNLIEKQTTYNEEQLKRQIPNLSNRKRELWNKIMLTLQMNETELTGVEGRRKLDFVVLLQKKKLFNQAYRMNLEMMEWCEDNEQVIYKTLCQGYFTGMLQYIKPHWVYGDEEKLRKEILENAERITINLQAYDFYSRVYEFEFKHEVLRNRETQNYAKHLLNLPNASLPVNKMSLHVQSYFLEARCRLYSVLRDSENSKKVAEDLLGRFQKRKLKKAIEISGYFDALLLIMPDCCKQKEYHQWDNYLKEYKRVLDKHFKDDVFGQGYYITQRLLYHYHTNQLTTSSKVLKETAKYCSEENHPAEILRQLEKELCVIYFYLKEYDKAWKISHHFFDNIKPDMFTDRQEFMRLFFLFIILEKKDWTYLITRIKQYEKFLKAKDKNLYAFDRAVVDFLKRMVMAGSARKEQIKNLDLLLVGITNLYSQDNIYVKEVMAQFDFRQWIINKKNAIQIGTT